MARASCSLHSSHGDPEREKMGQMDMLPREKRLIFATFSKLTENSSRPLHLSRLLYASTSDSRTLATITIVLESPKFPTTCYEFSRVGDGSLSWIWPSVVWLSLRTEPPSGKARASPTQPITSPFNAQRPASLFQTISLLQLYPYTKAICIDFYTTEDLLDAPALADF